MRTILYLLLNSFLLTTAFAEERIEQQCVELNSIEIDDETLHQNQKQKLFKQYMGSCIDGELLRAIMTDISDFYIKRGHITTRPYLQQQTMSDGQIEISVLTGSIENIVDATTKTSNAKIETAFAFQKGKTLNLRDLETSLEMMNRPPSSNSKFEIMPGNSRGASIVEIKSVETFPYHLNIGASGKKTISDNNPYLTAEMSVDNPLNINDIIALRYNGSRVQKEYQGNNGGELNYSFPIAAYLIELVGSNVSYRQGVSGVNDTYLSTGNTKGTRFRISKVLVRDQKNKFNAAFSIYHKNTKNYFSNQLIEVSSYKTTLAQIDLTHTYLQGWGQITTTYSHYQGVDWFGARDDGYTSAEMNGENQAKLQFKKHSADINLLYRPQDNSYQITSNFHLQRTNDMLYDNDKLTVGSDYTVRGYSSPNLYGNNARYLKNDVTKTWRSNSYPLLLQTVSLFAGLDYGRVKCETDNKSSCGNVHGAAVGLRTNSKKLTTSFVWSKPLKDIDPDHKLKGLFKFDVTWTV